MAVKLIDLKPSGYLNSEVVDDRDPVEYLMFMINNILVLEKTVFIKVLDEAQHLNEVLLSPEGDWLKSYFNNKVAVQETQTTYSFDYKHAIQFKIICEILLTMKYSLLSAEKDPLEIPNLPASNKIEDEDIPNFYKFDTNGRIREFEESATIN